jgi:hypothetical protein
LYNRCAQYIEEDNKRREGIDIKFNKYKQNQQK